MVEYIEKEAAIREIHRVYQEISQEKDIEKIVGGGAYLLDMGASEAIIALPAVDVRENVRGEWIDKGSLSCRCSACGCKNNRETPFCPNCGAKMEVAAIKEAPTNADRIRAMTDEEMAEFLTALTDPEWHKNDEFPDYKPTAFGWLGWLRSSVEVTE